MDNSNHEQNLQHKPWILWAQVNLNNEPNQQNKLPPKGHHKNKKSENPTKQKGHAARASRPKKEEKTTHFNNTTSASA
jgi:hypothetical protein